MTEDAKELLTKIGKYFVFNKKGEETTLRYAI